MASILVATDCSGELDGAIECGLALGGQLGFETVVVHVAESDVDGARLAEARRALQARSGRSGGEARFHILTGPPADTIAQAARALDAAIIVLGQHRHALLRDLFGTGTAEEVVGETSRLVLVAADASSNSFEKVLVAIDFSEPSHRAVEAAMNLFPKAELHLVHAYGAPYRAFLPDEDVKDDVRAEHAELLEQALDVHETAFLDALGGDLRERCVLRQGETVAVIAKEARELGVDLLVIGTSGGGGLLARPLGRVARALLEDPPCHVLAVRKDGAQR